MSDAKWKYAIIAAASVSAVACGGASHDQAKASDRTGTTVAVPAPTPNQTRGQSSGQSPGRTAPDTSIVVNGVALTATTIQQLQQIYPVRIAPGRYWYDPISGAYGSEGAPIAGQMLPGLALGGALAAGASRGTSGVFINGRQLTGGEKAYIELLCRTPAVPGRYWVLATGVGGIEGQPASFNLAQCPGVPQRGGGARSMSRTYCDANGACTSTGILGYITTVLD